MKYICTSLIGKRSVDPRPEELDRAAKVFVKAGGSWERLYNGSVDDMALLKQVLRIAAQDGYITPKADWK